MRLTAFVSSLLLAVAAVSAAAAQPLASPINNPGFEKDTEGWGWNINNGCNVTFSVTTQKPHSGSKCIEFTDETGYLANSYGRFSQFIPVAAETEYELRLWVRGEDVKSGGDTNHITDWNSCRIDLPTGTFDWQQLSTRFKTKPGQTTLNLGINLVNACKVLAIDDLTLNPTSDHFKGEGIEGTLIAPTKILGHNTTGNVRIQVSSSLSKPVTYVLKIGKNLFSVRGEIKPGDNNIEHKWNTGKVPYGELAATLEIFDTKGKQIASASQRIEKSDSSYFHEIDAAEARFKSEFMPLYKQCQKKKLALDYPTVTKTTLEQFFPLVRDDVRKDHTWRVKYAITDFKRSLDQAISDMKAYLADPQMVPNARRYVTSRTEIKDYHFEGKRIDSRGKVDYGPVFFTGYGHFSRLRIDMPRWPGYGVNVIQSSEFGPSAVFPEEGKVDLKFVNEIARAFDDAAKKNVKIDLLISPHYFPEWALNKWPHLRNGGGGFLTFIPDEKEAKQVVEDYLRIVIPIFRDKPALNTICLSNEPELRDTARATNTRPMWNAYLSKVHGNTETANKLYGTSYKSFDDVPIPGNNDYAAPQFYDWCSFNNERFAAWHKWMADIIHEMAPGVPVHAKVMSTAFFQDHPAVGTDRELFAELGQLNGNDCYFQGAGASGWAVPWQFMAISYDLQRSVARKPIFNSENHLTPDFNTIYVSPDHYRTALWQGAVHGQGITTIWCWERVDDPGNCLYGLVMDRPGCAEAVGKVNLDLNRFADEVAAIQNEKSPVAILYSTTSFAKDQGFTDACRQVHPGLSFHGFKVDFITEKQLQAGKGKEYKLIVFPQTTHVLPETFKAVKALPESVKLAFYGDCLSQDPYGNPMPADELKSLQDRALTISKPQGWNFGFDMPSELEKLGALPEVRVVDALTGKPIWGLEWIPAKIGNRTVISIINLRNVDMHVKILLNGKRVDAKDLLSLGGKDLVRLIKPITPVLAELSQD